MTWSDALRRGCAVLIATGAALFSTVDSRARETQPERVLLEAEQFVTDGNGWQPIAVGEGNYFVDSIGAGHYSGGQMLRLASDRGPAIAQADIEIERSGEYRVWARYDFPWRDAPASFRVQIQQAGETVFDQPYGGTGSQKMWFFNLPDAPWQDFQNGVEGPVSESHNASLTAGASRVTLLGESLPAGAADRIVDFVLLTTDLSDDFRRNGERLYPILDEIGRAVPNRLYARLTNPPEASADLSIEAQYTLNRAPWRSPAVQLGARGAVRGNTPGVLAPGTSSSWMNLTCQDTTRPCHLHLRAQRPLSATPTIEFAHNPDEAGVLRRIELTDLNSELIVSIPPYPAMEPGRIRTLPEILTPIVESLESETPPGRLPRRFPVYGGLGDNVERRLDADDATTSLLRKLFFAVGANAFNNLNLSALPAEIAAMKTAGRSIQPFVTYGDYRWFPTPERIEKAQRDIDAAGARQLLRGFTLGDEIKLSDWYPRDDTADTLFRNALQVKGEVPESFGADDWSSLRLDASPRNASNSPRLFVRSRQFQDDYALRELRTGVDRIHASFGPDTLVGANFSPHPDFRPEVARFVRAFREGGMTLASHSDYWWQASEMGPESTGFLLDAFRAGMRDRSGVIQPYVMPHSPGNTDRDFMLGLWTAVIHGARAVDLFRVGPEQINTENYISSDNAARYQTVRRALHLLGPAEETLIDGSSRPTTVALVLSESTERWEGVTSARGPGIPDGTRLSSQASNTEMKGIWQALRHAHIPADMLTEDDLATDVIDRYGVIYLVGPWLSKDAVPGLIRWVQNGGTLVSTAGAGTLDEFSTPSPELSVAQGIEQRSLNAPETFLRPRVEVPRLSSLGRVSMLDSPGAAFDAVAWSESLAPGPTTTVLARFDDGTAAITSHALDRGKAITIGTLPGVSYLRSGMPQPPPLPDRGPFMHQALTGWDPTIRDVITRWAEVAMPDRPSASDPLIELGLVETPAQIAIPLANSGERATEVEIAVPRTGQVLGVSTVQQGPIPFSIDGQTLRLRVTLDVIDMLLVDRVP